MEIISYIIKNPKYVLPDAIHITLTNENVNQMDLGDKRLF